MNNKKTVRQWLQLLKEPYRSQILSYKLVRGDDIVVSLSDALLLSTGWESTIEGDEYWNNLYRDMSTNPDKYLANNTEPNYEIF